MLLLLAAVLSTYLFLFSTAALLGMMSFGLRTITFFAVLFEEYCAASAFTNFTVAAVLDTSTGDCSILEVLRPSRLSSVLRLTFRFCSRRQKSLYSKWHPVTGSWYFYSSSSKWIPLKLSKSISSISLSSSSYSC